jgi:hypothetical protein
LVGRDHMAWRAPAASKDQSIGGVSRGQWSCFQRQRYSTNCYGIDQTTNKHHKFPDGSLSPIAAVAAASISIRATVELIAIPLKSPSSRSIIIMWVTMEAVAAQVITVVFVIVAAAAHHSIAMAAPAPFILIAAPSIGSILIFIPPTSSMVALMHAIVFFAPAHALLLVSPTWPHRKALRQLPLLLFG